MQIVRWPPEIDLISALGNTNYQLSTQYFFLNLSLVALALLFGVGMLECILRISRPSGNTLKLKASEVVFFAAFLGFAVIIAELFLLALAGFLSLPAIKLAFLVSIAIFGALLVGKNARLGSVVIPPVMGLKAVITIVFVLFLALYQYSSAASMNIGDSTSYHVPYADVFLKNHGLTVDYHLIYPFHTLNINLLFTLALALKHDLSFVQAVHALFATLTMYGIYVACLRFGGRYWLAVLLPFIFAQLYVIRFNRYSATVDLGSMFFIFGSVYALLLWRESRESLWLLLASAISFGIAMGSKYIMSVFSLPIAIFIVLVARKEFVKPLLIYACCAAVWGLWWYVRNLVLSGNPVHPFATGIFGYYLWDEFDMQNQMENLQNSFAPASLIGFIGMPIYAALNGTLVEQHVFHVLAALYLALPFLLFATPTARFIPLFCFSQLLFWMLSAPDPRYMMPVVPLVFVYVAAVINGLIDRLEAVFKRVSSKLAVLLQVLQGILLAAALALAGFRVQQQFTNLLYYGIDPAQGRIGLLEYFPDYDLVEKANAEFGENGRIFEFGYRNIRWFFKGTILGTQFGEHGYYRVLRQSEEPGRHGYSAKKLESVLRSQYGVEGFMIPHPPYFIYDEAEFDDQFQLVYRNKSGSIYRIKNASNAAAANQEIR